MALTFWGGVSMPRPAISEEVVRQVEEIWGRDPNQRAKEIHYEMAIVRGNRVSIRKVQQIIRDLKQN